MICRESTCGARRLARSSWLVAGSGAITISAPATASASSVVARARRAVPCRPSAARTIVGSSASGPSACCDRLQRRTLWPARARSAAVANPPLPPPSTVMSIGVPRTRGAPPRAELRLAEPSRNRSRRAQLRDFHVRVLEHPGQNLIGVLAEPRRRCHLQTHRPINLDRGAERPGLAVERMIHLDDHAALGHLGIRQYAVYAQDRCCRNAESLQTLEPVLGRPRSEGGLDQRHQDVAVEDAVAVGREPQV